MKMKKPEKKEEFPVGKKLIDAEIVCESSEIKRVKLIFDDNRAVEFIHGSYSSGAQIYVEEPPEVVDKWRVSGIDLSNSRPTRVLFDRESDAKDYGDGYMQTGYFINKIKMPKEALEPNDGDEIPF